MCGDWRLGRFQTWILLANSVFPPRESCRSQALAPISCIYLSSGRGVRAHTHTPSTGPAPGPGLGTACQLMRNFRSFCNNFWNLHAFLNSHPHLSPSLVWIRGLWIKLPGKENEILPSPSVFGLGWLFRADSMLPQVCLLGFDHDTHLNLFRDFLLKL